MTQKTTEFPENQPFVDLKKTNLTCLSIGLLRINCSLPKESSWQAKIQEENPSPNPLATPANISQTWLQRMLHLREAPWNDKCCSNGFCPNSFSTPPPSSNRTLWGYFFRQKLVNFLKQRFWLWELIFWKWQWSNIILRWYSDGNQVR